MSVAVVLEQYVAATDRGNEQILASVVVNVGESGTHADPAWQSDACFLSDVPEFAAADVFPEFVSSNLINKVEVVQAVAVHISNRNGAAVIVVAHPHVFGDVVHGVVNEPDPAFFQLVGELKLMKHLKLLGRIQLGLLPRSEGIFSHIVFRIAGSDGGIGGDNYE
jgi:hypothetical protein